MKGVNFTQSVSQIFDWKTEIRVKSVCHHLPVIETMKDGARPERVGSETNRDAAVMYCDGTIGGLIHPSMTQERASMGQRKDLGWDSVDRIRAGYYNLHVYAYFTRS